MISELNRSATGTAKRTAWLARSEKSIGRRIFAMGNMTASVPDLTAAGQAKAGPFQMAVARARVATIGRASIVALGPAGCSTMASSVPMIRLVSDEAKTVRNHLTKSSSDISRAGTPYAVTSSG